jgi:hypothetical protein
MSNAFGAVRVAQGSALYPKNWIGIDDKILDYERVGQTSKKLDYRRDTNACMTCERVGMGERRHERTNACVPAGIGHSERMRPSVCACVRGRVGVRAYECVRGEESSSEI